MQLLRIEGGIGPGGLRGLLPLARGRHLLWAPCGAAPGSRSCLLLTASHGGWPCASSHVLCPVLSSVSRTLPVLKKTFVEIIEKVPSPFKNLDIVCGFFNEIPKKELKVVFP